MKHGIWYTMACVFASGLVIVACSGQTATAPVEPEATPAVAEESPPDPGPEQARQVKDFVRQWVEERVGDGNIYSIPPRAGREVAGTLAGFHTVHQMDADTYSVCVDFQDGENMYDVDFFIDRTAADLTLSDHYLHKINGEAVE